MRRINWKYGEPLLLCFTFCIVWVMYCFHWKFDLPFHPNVDEDITINAVKGLLSGDSLLIRVFNYPHLPFYWGGFWCEIVSIFTSQFDVALITRFAECGFALLTNVCVYLTIKELTGSIRWGYIGLLVAISSLYQAQYLYYAGPDVMLYGMANIVIYLGIKIYKEKSIPVVFHKWYPLMAFCIGLAVSAKYHGIMFGIYWLMIHLIKKYYKSYKNNVCFILNCFLIIFTWLVCNISVVIYFDDFISGISGIFNNYGENTFPPLVHSNPMLGYLNVFFCHNFGFMGMLLMLFGITYLLKCRHYRKFAVVIIAMPILVLFILGNFKIMLGRNLSLIMPFTYFYITYGLYALEQDIKLKFRKMLINILICIMVSVNVYALIASEGYDESYQAAEEWIENNLPEGSTIYVFGPGHSPVFKGRQYAVISSIWRTGMDILPDELGDDEYYIVVEYGDMRYIQKEDFPLLYGDAYVNPEWAETYFSKIAKYKKIASFSGITYEHGWRYRIGYFDIFRYSREDYYIGPTIEIYGHE